MRNISRVVFSILIINLFIMRPVPSYADWHDHNDNGHSNDSSHSHNSGHNDDSSRNHDYSRRRSYVNIGFSVWPDNYYYSAPYYSPDDEVFVSPPVTVIQQPPAVIEDQAPSSPPPISPTETISDTSDSFTINIPNNKGGYTAVTLKKSGSGYIGPQGEFYPEFPKVSQLEVIYGK